MESEKSTDRRRERADADEPQPELESRSDPEVGTVADDAVAGLRSPRLTTNSSQQGGWGDPAGMEDP